MTKPVSLFQLIDGPLIERRERRDAVIREMAAALVKYDAFHDRKDAIDVLLRCEYPTFDVFALGVVDDAMMVAQQELVAVEMSQS